MDLRDQLFDLCFAQRALFKRRPIKRPSQLESRFADTATLRFRVNRDVIVEWHGLGGLSPPDKRTLPARFCHSGNQSVGSQLTKRDSRHLESTNVCTATSGDEATVHNPCRAS